MRKITGLLLAALSFQVAVAQTPVPKKNLSLDDIYKKNVFSVKNVPGFNAMKDGRHYTKLETEGGKQYIQVYDLETGNKDRVVFDNSANKYSGSELNVEDYSFSADEKKVLLLTKGEHIYRRSASYIVYVLDVASGNITLIDDEKILHATFSPDASKVAYVKENNLFVRDLAAGQVAKVTNDGERNKIINGNCDWVYEEEFGFTRAYDWSKDGHYLAYYRFDESKVPEYTIAKYTGLYPEQYTYKYPKAGERNSEVQVRIYNVDTKATVNTSIGSENDQYIPRIKWTNEPGALCVYRLNRLQNQLELLRASAGDGNVTPIYTEANKCYISIDDEITFLPGGESMIIKSEQGGYSHLYNWNWKSKKLVDITGGSFDVDALTGVDIAHKLVYYTAADPSPLQRRLYVCDWMGKKKKCLTTEPGMHQITPCEGYNYFLDRYSQLNKVPVYYLRNAKGNVIRTLEDNSALEASMKGYVFGNIKMIKVKGVDDELDAWMITPPGFDSTKKYPVLMFQYSGPGSQQVADKFPIGYYFWHQMLASKGYIILCTDGRGTGFRGEAFRKKTYQQLGKYESEDQIAVARYMGGLPYVDKNRIGIWGWSYGGFMSSTCLMKGNDVFKMAVAVAPVTNWRYYDNIYTERYMRTPKENPLGYDSNSPVKMVDRLKGKFLLIHGTADDNVHFQNSVMLVNAMIAANKEYDSEYYPDKNHGISGGNTTFHLFNRMTDFILKNL
jgi:dipeptidyl-peptidase-4